MISVIISSALEDDVLAVKGCKALGLFDERTYTPYECAHTFAPARTMEEIRKFIGALMTFFDGCAIEVLVYGFCLFSRLTRVMGKSVMNQWRWRLSLLACFMEAHKLLEDKPYSNAMFLRMWKRAKSVSVQGPGILLRELNDMESTLLKLLDFSVLVSRELYDEVYGMFADARACGGDLRLPRQRASTLCFWTLPLGPPPPLAWPPGTRPSSKSDVLLTTTLARCSWRTRLRPRARVPTFAPRARRPSAPRLARRRKLSFGVEEHTCVSACVTVRWVTG
jgi:hypothetical protein